ncbi:MAG: tetratricopeptide repeat protein [Anaerolineales bacterium]|nr:tetratricopeptide repeat protein [Anaerolineales bacterium]
MAADIEQNAGDNVDQFGEVHGDVHIYKGALLSPVTSLHQLPAPPADFTGRQAELSALLSARKRGATISGLRGLGGVGKTALALVLAHQLAADYPDAQLFIDLMGTTEPMPASQAMRQVIHAWHPEARLPEDKAELRALYCSVLNGKKVLLLLDNARSKEQVEPLLPPAGCYALVTSRWQFTLPGLHTCDLDALPREDAIQLLLGIAPRLNEQASALAELCGCLPLALRVSASALAERPSLPVDEFLAKLQAARLELTGAEAAIRLSYDLLAEEMQSRLAFLGVFPAPFDRAAAAAVWMEPEPITQDALDGLVSFSLLAWDEGEQHFRLHDLVRDFAWGRLSEAEQNAAGYRHAKYYQRILYKANQLLLKGGKDYQTGLALFDQEWEHICTGQEWSAQRIQQAEAAKLCSNYAWAWRVLSLRLHPRHYITWLEAALDASRKIGNVNAERAHLTNLGSAYAAQGESRRAVEFYEQYLVNARQTGDRRGEGVALGNLGNAYADLGETRRAVNYHEQSLIIAREIGDRNQEGVALSGLGSDYVDLGDARRAIEFYEQHLIIAREIGDRGGEEGDLCNLGNAYIILGEIRRAIEFYKQALAIASELSDRRVKGSALGNLGSAYYQLGEIRRAIEFYEQQLVITGEIGDRRGEGNANWGLANCCKKAGRIDEAVAHAREALSIFEAIESPSAKNMRQLLANLQKSSQGTQT